MFSFIQLEVNKKFSNSHDQQPSVKYFSKMLFIHDIFVYDGSFACSRGAIGLLLLEEIFTLSKLFY